MKRKKVGENEGTKKRKWVLPVVIAASIIVLLLLLFVVGSIVMVKKGLGVSTGRYLAAKSGTSMVVLDNSPVVMSNQTKRDLFKNLESGDEILIVHGGIKESYPGGTGVTAVFKLEDGSIEDIPEKVISDLTAMGWLEPEMNMDEGFPDWGLTLSVKNVTPAGLTLVCTKKGGNPSGELMCGDEYHLIALEEGNWKDVPTVIEEYCWNSMAYWITEGQDTEFNYSWEWLYGKLPAGAYRLTKEFMDFRETGDFETAKYWVEFEITD